MNDSGFDYDNFAIRSYPESEIVTVLNFPEDESRVYHAGEELKGWLYIENNWDRDLENKFEIELEVGGKPLLIGENNSGAVFDGLKVDESHLIPYTYIVTEEDAAAGKIVSEAKLKIDGEYYDYASVLTDSLSYEVKAAAEDESGEEPEGGNPPTGAAAGFAMIAIAAAAMITVKKSNRAAVGAPTGLDT